jgi:hypothetical protein
MSLGVKQIWDDYNVALAYHPLLVKCCTAAVIMGSADLTGQLIERLRGRIDSKSDVDWKRSARYAVFGCVVFAPWTHYYFLWLDHELPPTENPFSVSNIVKVLFDQFVRSPIFTVVLIACLSAMEGKGYKIVVQELKDTYYSTLRAGCKCNIDA